MQQRIEKQELVSLVAQRVDRDVQSVEEIVEALLEEIYQALKRGQMETNRCGDWAACPSLRRGRLR